MVEDLRNALHPDSDAGRPRSTDRPSVFPAPAFIHRQWKATILVAILVVGASWALGSSISNPRARASMPASHSSTTPKVGPAHSRQTTRTTTTSAVAPVMTTPTPVTTPPVT